MSIFKGKRDDIQFLPRKNFRESARSCVGVASTQGRRQTMEDSFFVEGRFRDNQEEDLFGIFDGFSGSQASQMFADSFPSIFKEHLALAESYLHAKKQPAQEESSNGTLFRFQLDSQGQKKASVGPILWLYSGASLYGRDRMLSAIRIPISSFFRCLRHRASICCFS
eukprot:Rmarinus@m.11745